MKIQEQAPRIVSKLLICLAVAGGSVIVGCSSEVGSSPSSKSEIKEFINKDSGKSQFTGKGRASGKATQSPKSIKSKLFAPDAEKSE